ncbi:TrkH family potassium uptake protein [Sinanaerobacter chloroacetimidivorans]|jgi:trk system potassium uptake protein TrkH|uniref:TrkH family potassium uptake protein n=1 Tax=Sinanaerobacter chloroacetimidivorans TaxID=2818044 RepID=A0A8J7VYH6_9FIRM|nr:TrkH family potassium uptake protein [Sinanaerobacter chloroacetimidivorans]MBR0597021.1 TrkH family potassium uptake protein [Sinanaerobacter chloroacetimidivorans]
MAYITYSKKNKKLTNISPTRIIVSSFVMIIFVGACLLNLPMASNDGKSIGFLDALFTATSATCVTGLVVADTLTQWTLLGQIVILILIQVGGLGLVTLTTFFSVLLGKKVSLKGKIIAQESISEYSYTDVLGMIKNIVLITAVIELIGAAFLSISFVPRFGVRGIYLSIFHSISAFCNAGFDLFGNYSSLTGFYEDPLVIYATALLIIVGGLGFIVWKDLYHFRIEHKLYLHTKIVLIVTFFLIVFGAVSFFGLEYSNPDTMGGLTLFQKVNAAFFHSVTCRTAGFNTLPLDEMSEVSKMVSILLMYIGAAPGSTAGGIKVTTFGIILMAIISNIKGDSETIVLRRRVSQEVVSKALSIVGLSMVLIFIMTVIINGVEKLSFINVLYEVTSSFGTVGLSTGMTPSLHNISKILIIFTMFLGRVGPLTFAIAIAMRANKRMQNAVFPEGKIMVG